MPDAVSDLGGSATGRLANPFALRPVGVFGAVLRG
jgi:hypothetical protein